MRIFHKITLFFNAFLFMNLIFLSKEIYLFTAADGFNNVILAGIILLSVFIILGFFGFIFLYRKPNSVGAKCLVVKKHNTTASYYFGYFSLFVLLFMSFTFDDIFNLITFIVLILALAIVYCRNDLFYINPTILLLGKRVYSLQVKLKEKTEEVNVITSEKIVVGTEYYFFFSNYELTTCNKELKILNIE